MSLIPEGNDGFKRIRLIAAVAAGGMFGVTAFDQFKGEPGGAIILGILVSAAVGFCILWVLMTVVGLVMGKLRKGR